MYEGEILYIDINVIFICYYLSKILKFFYDILKSKKYWKIFIAGFINN